MFNGPQLIVLFTAMLPISELRGAIPVALGVYKMSVLEAYFWSVLGNVIPVIILLWFLEPVSKFLAARSRILNKFFSWLFERTRRRHKQAIQKWGPLALVLFVAIPLPITGGWTGSIVAFVFGIPFKKALPLIFLGILIAGVVVTLTSLGVIKII
jgi:uncharacterized membrane protein